MAYRLLLLFVVIRFTAAVQTIAQEKIAPKTKLIIEALEKALPEYEMAVDRLEKALQPFTASTDPKVVLAVDSARLQIMATRSVRKIIADQPNYLLYHIGPANLPRWQEGAEYFLDSARSGKDPFAGMSSGVRPFRSKIDGQLLLYKFSLPKDYDPKRKYPLRVNLHAGGGLASREVTEGSGDRAPRRPHLGRRPRPSRDCAAHRAGTAPDIMICSRQNNSRCSLFRPLPGEPGRKPPQPRRFARSYRPAEAGGDRVPRRLPHRAGLPPGPGQKPQ
jgi:hypothetical protein